MADAGHRVTRADITGLVLAGGRGSRMDGVDKGLQDFQGRPLAQHALARLQTQIGACAISANRNLDRYRAFGVPVWPDAEADFAGPLAGMLAGLRHCQTPYLLTVPCDTPFFPLDLAARLGERLCAEDADIAMAVAPDTEASTDTVVLRRQPVFCLIKVTLRDSLADFLHAGERKIGAWAVRHRLAEAVFDQPGDAAARAFANLNTAEDLRDWQRRDDRTSPRR